MLDHHLDFRVCTSMWSYCELFICSFGEVLGTTLFLVVVSFPSGLGNSALTFYANVLMIFSTSLKRGEVVGIVKRKKNNLKW